jgi:hypothetical protein
MKDLAIVILIILIVSAGVLLYIKTTANGWKCENGQWVQYGQPTTLMPTGKCADENQTKLNQEVKLSNLKIGDIINSPFTLEGEAKGI